MSNGILTMLTMVATSGCVLIFGIIHRLSIADVLNIDMNEFRGLS